MRALKNVIPQLNQDFSGSQIYNFTMVDKHIYLLPKEKHTHTFIWLHGLDDTPHNFLALFNNPEVNPLTPETKVILLAAPERPITRSNGQVMTSWFDVKSQNKSEKFEDYIDIKTTEETNHFVTGILENEIKQLGNPKNVFLGGFSQGCMISLFTGLNINVQLGGILGFGGYLWPIVKSNEASEHTPILIFHGKDDDRVPWKFAEQSYQTLLKNHKGPITLEVEEGIAHHLSVKSFGHIKKFVFGI